MCRDSPARSPTAPRPPSRRAPTSGPRRSRSRNMNIDPEVLLSALRAAGGKGLSLKQLAGHLQLGRARNHPLRRALTHLLEEGRATYDGHPYRERPRRQARDGDGRKPPPSSPERGAKEPGAAARKPGSEATGT